MDNVFFRFDPQTGFVETYLPGGSSAATEATSVDGTYVLARNLANILTMYGDQLSPDEYGKIDALSQAAYRLADEQKAFLAENPQLTNPYDGDEDGVNVLFFNVEEYGRADSPDVLKTYEEFSAVYRMLVDMGQLETVPPEVRDTLETNAALISQLTFLQFCQAAVEE